ncbi:MAG: DUF484 family protein [Burkholderiaceae bacterium]|nr:DUF484 family protein [Burkholderiaceae bacterium]
MKVDDVARYLAEHPDFFEQHPELLGVINIPHPQNGQAISLVERQSLLLRDRIRALEARIAEMLRHGEENDVIADKVVRWARALLLQTDPVQLPSTAVEELKRLFAVPFGAVRVWDVQPAYAGIACAEAVSDDVKRLASSMQAPFCGSNVGFEAARWMAADEGAVHSLAMLPLRIGASPDAFGLLVLGSPDKDRFQITMGTAFLARIAELASAALARLRTG